MSLPERKVGQIWRWKAKDTTAIADYEVLNVRTQQDVTLKMVGSTYKAEFTSSDPFEFHNWDRFEENWTLIYVPVDGEIAEGIAEAKSECEVIEI